MSEDSIERMYEAYNAFNGNYEGIEMGDIIESNLQIGLKARALRWITNKMKDLQQFSMQAKASSNSTQLIDNIEREERYITRESN